MNNLVNSVSLPPRLRRTLCFAAMQALLFRAASAQQVPEHFSIASVGTYVGYDVVGFTFLPDGRIIVIQKESGAVRLMVDGSLRADPIYTVDHLVPASERGLLGVAVDPDFPDSNFVYLFHSRDDSTNRVTRFAVSGDLDDSSSDNLALVPESARTLLSLPDTSRFHNGGTLRFGRDKKLYISHGDDAYANRVQSLSTVNGKIFRINRDGSIPPDNPVFPEAPMDARRETYAFGLRNPFRFNIDPENNLLFIGDVGTNLFEELNVSAGGENFGYPHYEGLELFREWEPLILPEPTFPVFSYAHDRGAGAGSPIALVAYRPLNYPMDKSFPPEYDGAYFYSDFFDTTLRYIQQRESGTWESQPFASGFSNLVDGSIGPDGSLYVLEFGGALYRISFEGISNVAVEDEVQRPAFEIRQNYPNPASRKTTIPITVREASVTKLSIVDLLGRQVQLLHSGTMAPGRQDLVTNVSNLPNGIYFLRLESAGFVETRQMVVAR